MNNKLSLLLDEKKILLADGAIGTNLFDVGLEAGEAPEFWNINQPEKIRQLHKSFVDSVSYIILTNTFGANSCRLELHNAKDKVSILNQEAVKIAREVASNSERDIIVAGSVGPTGEMLFPLGVLSEEQAAEVFLEQMKALAKADVIWIETMSCLNELKAAIYAAKQVKLPIISTMSFDTNGRTMMGISPKDFAQQITDVYGVGCNCGVGPDDTIVAASEIQTDLIKVCKANCGVPEFKDGEIKYSASISDMKEYTKQAIEEGIKIIGGCCGTKSEHIKEMRKVIDNYK